MGKFNLAEAMQLDVSKLDTETKIEQIALDLVDPNPENFFTVEDDITDLAESIAINGLQQPLVVTPADNGRYRVIAGHRRRKALLQLAESDPDKWRTAPCIVKHPASAEMEMLMLIQTNTEAREISWYERTQAAEKVEKILVKLQQEQGVKLPGKMRENVAKIIKTSESQLARAKYIKDHLIPAAKKMGRSDDVCYKLAHLPKEDQEALCEHYKGHKYDLDGPAIKKYQNNIKAGRDPFYAEKYVRDCYRVKDLRKCDRSEFFEASEKCGRTTCCNYCPYRVDCPDACPHLAADIEGYKKGFFFAVGQRIRQARAAKGLNEDATKEIFQCFGVPVVEIETGLVTVGAQGIARFCQQVGCSADWLLGLTDEDKSAAAPAAPDGWNLTENVKPEDGQLCEVLVTDGAVVGDQRLCDTWSARWTGGKFVSAVNGKTETRKKILAWRPLPDPLDGYSFSIIKEKG